MARGALWTPGKTRKLAEAGQQRARGSLPLRGPVLSVAKAEPEVIRPCRHHHRRPRPRGRPGPAPPTGPRRP